MSVAMLGRFFLTTATIQICCIGQTHGFFFSNRRQTHGAPPDPPQGVTFAGCGERSVEVRWSLGRENSAPVTHYTVEYNTSFTPTVWTEAARIDNPSATSAVIALSPYANYTARVIAHNRFGASEPSLYTQTVCRTPPSVPYKNPSGVRTVGNKPGFIVVKWETMPEIQHNGPGFRYKLRIFGLDLFYDRTEVIYDWRQNTTVAPFSHYGYPSFVILVEAENHLGSCPVPPAAYIGHAAERRPRTRPRNLEVDTSSAITPTSAVLQWDPADLSPQQLQGEFGGYKIAFWKTTEPEQSRQEVLVHDDTQGGKIVAQVNNLPPNSLVQAQVFVLNTYYESDGSNIITLSTPSG